MFVASEYVCSLKNYRQLAGFAEIIRLLTAILAGKLGVAPNATSQRIMQRWAFFQLLNHQKNIQVSSVGQKEFRILYAGQQSSSKVEIALRVPDCDSSDSRVFEQIFIRQDYAEVLKWFSQIPQEKDIRTIMDIGANIGCAALFFCTQLPAPEVFCLEPEESNYARLLLNSNLNQHREIKCHRAALWTHHGKLDCSHDFRDGKEWGARFIEPIANDAKNRQRVSAMNIHELMAKTGFIEVDFLKMDVEGAEADLFRNQPFKNFLKEKVRRIAVEVHEEFIAINEVTNILNSLGFQTKFLAEFVCGVKII